MTNRVHMEFDSLPQEIKDFLAVMGNSLSGLKDLDCAKLFPKLDPTHPNGKTKYQGMLFGCMDSDGNVYFAQAGEIADREMSEQILLNKLTVVYKNQIIKSMEGRAPGEMVFSGAARGAGKFSSWIFGITGWPETVDDDLINIVLHMVQIIGERDYQSRNRNNQAGLSDALNFVGITSKMWGEIGNKLHRIVDASYALTFS